MPAPEGNKFGEGNEGGRPSLYKPEYAEQSAKLCKLGATNAELADFFEVGITTIGRWMAEHEEFRASIKLGKDESDSRVELSLYQKAMGYTFDSEKVFNHQGEIVRADIREHVPPDTAAMIFWLKNRKRVEWRDKIDHSHAGPDDGPIQTITAEMTPQQAAEAYAATLRE